MAAKMRELASNPAVERAAAQSVALRFELGHAAPLTSTLDLDGGQPSAFAL